MTAHSFLKRLYAKLKWQVPFDEAQDILRDYREIIEEERRSGKSEEEIIAALGSPRETVKAILSEKERKSRRPLYLLLFALAVFMALFYPISFFVKPLYYDLRSLFLRDSFFAIGEVYTFFAPIPALVLYAIQHKRGYGRERYPLHKRLYYGAFIVSCILTATVSIGVYQFLLPYQEYTRSYNIKLLATIDYLVTFATWIIAAAWLAGIYLSEKLGRFSLSLYFLYAAMLAAIAHYIDVLGSMNLEDRGMEISELLTYAFLPAASIFCVALIGIAIWCVCCHVMGRKRGDSNG